MGVNALEVRRRVMMAQPHKATATGEIASFRTDVISPLKMQFDLVPIQDLHGQANPYPPGGGKNLLNIPDIAETTANGITYSIKDNVLSINNTATAGTSVFSITLDTAMEEAEYTFSAQLLSGSMSGVNNSFNGYSSSNERTWLVPFGYAGKSASVTKTDNIKKINLSINNGAVFNNAKIGFQIEKNSSMTSFAPYSNICPITGHDGFTRTGAGKNLLNPALLKDQAAWNLIPIKVKPSTKYTASANKQADNGLLCYFNNTGQLGGGAYYSVYIGHPVTITSTAEGYVYISQRKASGDYSFADFEFQVEEGGNATTFETYTGVSYSTTFPTPPGTVYGCHFADNGDGTYDLTVDRANAVFDGSDDESWLSTTDRLIQLFALKLGNKGLVVNDECISNEFKNEPDISVSNGIVGFRVFNSGGYNDARIVVRPPWAEVGSTVQQLKTWLASNPLQVVYKLSNPTVYTGLTLTAIQSLIGQNHIWVDNADSVSVEYWGHI